MFDRSRRRGGVLGDRSRLGVVARRRHAETRRHPARRLRRRRPDVGRVTAATPATTSGAVHAAAEDAHAALKRWAGQKPFRPWTLRDGAKPRPSLRAVFLPHWVFDCEVSTRYRGSVGYDAGGGKHEWTRIETWRDGGTTPYPSHCDAVADMRLVQAQTRLGFGGGGRARRRAALFGAKRKRRRPRSVARVTPATTETLSEVTLRPMPSVRDARAGSRAARRGRPEHDRGGAVRDEALFGVGAVFPAHAASASGEKAT